MKQQVEIVEIAAAEFGVGVSNRLSSQCMSILIIFFFVSYIESVCFDSVYTLDIQRETIKRDQFIHVYADSRMFCVCRNSECCIFFLSDGFFCRIEYLVGQITNR